MVDAAYRIHDRTYAWFWSGTQYSRLTEKDQNMAGPYRVRDQWTCLANEDIGRVDAVCPVPGNEKRLLVFSGSNYVKLELDSKSLEARVETKLTPITTGWKTLGRAGWDRIDAAMVVPRSKENIYFFRGKEWIDVSWDDTLVSHGTIAESWPSLVEAKFETVDAILDNYDGTYYFFSGDRYARIQMEEDNDTLLGVPHLLKDQWSSLGWV
ncbi:unnamed protein product [Penicillium viridicatum]